MTNAVMEDQTMRNMRQKIMCLSLLFLTSAFATQQRAKAPYGSTRPLPEPILFGEGTISTGDMELNAAFTPDGRTLYFTKRTPKYQFWVIVVSHFQRGRWSEPEVAEFSGQYSDFDPWVVEKKGTGWSAPMPLAEPVNTKAQEFYPSVASNGTLYFSSGREGGKGRGDIYRARLVDGKYAEPENLGDAINSQYFEGDPYIAPDESYLVFVSYDRPEGYG